MITRSPGVRLTLGLLAAAAPAASSAQCDPIALVATETLPTCHGDDDGALTVSASGGDGAFTYAWTGAPGVNGATRIDLAAGVYEVTVSSCGGAESATRSFVLGEPDPLLAVAIVEDATCATDVNGNVFLSPTGGTLGGGAYAYDWADLTDSLDGFSDRSGLGAGSYSVIVTDANGCSTDSAFAVAQSGELRLAAQLTDPSTAGVDDGAIDLTVVGGDPLNYAFGWTGPSVAGETTEDLSGLGPGGYQVAVTEGGCSGAASFELDLDPPTVAVATTPSCAGAATGTIGLTIDGGVAPYVVAWDGGLSDGPDLADVPAGFYTATVTDADGRVTTAGALVEGLPVIDLSALTASSTGAADGGVDLTATGGSTTGFTFAWDNGATTEDLSGVEAGTYAVTVADVGNGCTATASYTVPLVDGPLFAEYTKIDLSCNGAVGGVCDGAFTLRVDGGVPPYTVNAVGGDDVGVPVSASLAAPTTEVYADLCAGAMTVEVVDAAGTRYDLGEVAIAEPTALAVELAAVTPVTAEGAANGAVDVSVTGGTAPYSFAWSSGATTEDAADLAEGDYELTVTDARGCALVTRGYRVSRFRVLGAIVREASCGDNRDGGVDITVGGAAGPYAFAWSDGSTTEDLRTAPGGTYTVTVTDEPSGATVEATYEVTRVSDLSVAAELTSDFGGAAVSCAGAADAGLLATVTGGSGPVELTWSNGATAFALTGVPEGRYGVTATDTTGCLARATVDVPAADPVDVRLAYDSIACPGEGEARLTAFATGGTGELLLTWNTGATGPRLIDLASGEYVVTAVDENGCRDTAATTVSVPTELVAAYSVTPATTVMPGGIALDVSGAVPPYRVRWGNRAGSRDELSLDDLPFGRYAVVVTDANACDTVELDIRVPNLDFGCFDAAEVLTPGLLDGLNDVFRVTCLEDFPDNSVEVFNRWGERVYRADGYDNDAVAFRGLDASGVPLEAGAYYYVVNYRDAEGAAQTRRGSVNVVR